MSEVKNWTFLVGISTQANGPIRKLGVTLNDLCKEIREHLRSCSFFEGAPFETVFLVFCIGYKEGLPPHYRRIDKRYSELPVSIQMRRDKLYPLEVEELKKVLCKACVDVLLDVARKYDLDSSKIRDYTCSDSL